MNKEALKKLDNIEELIMKELPEHMWETIKGDIIEIKQALTQELSKDTNVEEAQLALINIGELWHKLLSGEEVQEKEYKQFPDWFDCLKDYIANVPNQSAKEMFESLGYKLVEDKCFPNLISYVKKSVKLGLCNRYTS